MHYKWLLTTCGGGGEGGKHLAPIVMVKKSTEIIHIIPTYRVLKKRTNKTNKIGQTHSKVVQRDPKWST